MSYLKLCYLSQRDAAKIGIKWLLSYLVKNIHEYSPICTNTSTLQTKVCNEPSQTSLCVRKNEHTQLYPDCLCSSLLTPPKLGKVAPFSVKGRYWCLLSNCGQTLIIQTEGADLIILREVSEVKNGAADLLRMTGFFLFVFHVISTKIPQLFNLQR